MNVLYFVMIPVTLLISFGFVAAFVWAARSGQWDDLDLAPRKAIAELGMKTPTELEENKLEKEKGRKNGDSAT